MEYYVHLKNVLSKIKVFYVCLIESSHLAKRGVKISEVWNFFKKVTMNTAVNAITLFY